jgi:hypothetical protein
MGDTNSLAIQQAEVAAARLWAFRERSIPKSPVARSSGAAAGELVPITSRTPLPTHQVRLLSATV